MRQGVDTVVVVTEVLAVDTEALAAIALDTGSPVIASAVILVVDGMEAVTGEDVASTLTTLTEDSVILTSATIPTIIPITLTGIGPCGAILGGGVTESGCRTIIESIVCGRCHQGKIRLGEHQRPGGSAIF